ncbi:hypothetical protein [uncultured Draconibacterium sp.]|uniref:toxin-antitoxin system YwqK family antitoxin n=1 Tax=uncultured Draconibacterium sp. TaxID=1573823 RepID=UPI003260739C
MKTIINYFFLLVLFFVGCNFNQEKKVDTNENSKNDGITVIKKPYKNSTKIEYEIPVVSGTTIKHGIQKRFYLHGSVYSTIPYVAGKKQGITYTYYKAALGDKPQVWKEQPYENDELNGTCKRYHRNGTLQAEYEYKNGLRAVGLNEFWESGNAIKQPELVLTRNRVATGYYISARLSDESDKVDFFIGDLVEGRYMPENLKALQVRNGIGEIVVEQTSGTLTITAVYSTRYRNTGV